MSSSVFSLVKQQGMNLPLAALSHYHRKPEGRWVGAVHALQEADCAAAEFPTGAVRPAARAAAPRFSTALLDPIL